MVASIFDIVPMSSYHFPKSSFKQICSFSIYSIHTASIYSEIQLFLLPKKDL